VAVGQAAGIREGDGNRPVEAASRGGTQHDEDASQKRGRSGRKRALPMSSSSCVPSLLLSTAFTREVQAI
jgi:hypothetical protein